MGEDKVEGIVQINQMPSTTPYNLLLSCFGGLFFQSQFSNNSPGLQSSNTHEIDDKMWGRNFDYITITSAAIFRKKREH